jgi:hypothetical protein
MFRLVCAHTVVRCAMLDDYCRQARAKDGATGFLLDAMLPFA